MQNALKGRGREGLGWGGAVKDEEVRAAVVLFPLSRSLVCRQV